MNDPDQQVNRRTGAEPVDSHPARYWHPVDGDRLQCDLCPRECRLRDGQRGFCFVRMRIGDQMVLSTYGRSSGFCIDPIEKKPLNHFYPGSSVLSFGTAGCNLGCTFCQNWDISKSREMDRLLDQAAPAAVARAAKDWDCRSVAFTYNDPVIFTEYAVDVAAACHELGLQTVAVTAGYVQDAARRDFFAGMDATNVDLKAFSDDFYREVTGGRLRPVLDTLTYLKQNTDVWLEITTLLIPGLNDSAVELKAMCRWLVNELGPDVPHHFTAFHPDHRMRSQTRTPLETLAQAREIALAAGMSFVYTGNVRNRSGDATRCPSCGTVLIQRDRYRIVDYRLDGDGCCPRCGHNLPGRFGTMADDFGAHRIPIRIGPSGRPSQRS